MGIVVWNKLIVSLATTLKYIKGLNSLEFARFQQSHRNACKSDACKSDTCRSVITVFDFEKENLNCTY